MTEAQAHQFVSRWRRVLIPWAARTEIEAIGDMHRSMLGVMMGMLLVIVCASTLRSPQLRTALLSSAFLLFCFAFYLVVGLRNARRKLDKS